MSGGLKCCEYCLLPIEPGQRWVRQKVRGALLAGEDGSYAHYHAEPEDGRGESCWEKYQLRPDACRVYPIPAEHARGIASSETRES